LINIVVADDNQLIRKILIALFNSEPDFKVVGEARDGFEAVNQVNRLHPDVLVLDLMMPGLKGLEVLAKLRQSNTQIASVILSMHTDLAYVRESLRLSAKAYVPKDAPPEELIQAVREAAAGRNFSCSLLPAVVNS
jgi:DNA-binding NarL/FixJ family response regulator